MITAAQDVRCDRCGRPDWLSVATAAEARAQLEVDGWEVVDGRDVCSSCVAEASMPAVVWARDAAYEAGVF